jgi:superfamily I DNA and/or RNA helicase
MREADVIVCTSIGAADPRLLAACGVFPDEDEDPDEKTKQNRNEQVVAPDGRPALKMPFVIVDEACQSVEPATLIPLLSTSSCRSLVMLGDPCQLPPTVISDSSGQGDSPLSLSLMSRLASTVPAPVIVTAQADKTPKENNFLNMRATRDASSFIRYKSGGSVESNLSYRKQFSGSLLLTVQYRMHPSIAAFSSSIFYDGLLSTPGFLCKHRNFPEDFKNVLQIEKGTSGVRFINVEGRNNEKRGDSSLLPNSLASRDLAMSTPDTVITNESISNKAEASQIINFLKEVMGGGNDLDSPFQGSIGIITPYSAQVALIKSMMSQDSDFTSLIRGRNISIEVNSVDAYQGRERDVILFSAVRSNRRDSVGFLSDWRRMNVALTRAKSGLIVFGDMTTLKRGDKHWGAFCKWADDLGCVFDVGPLNDDV